MINHLTTLQCDVNANTIRWHAEGALEMTALEYECMYGIVSVNWT